MSTTPPPALSLLTDFGHLDPYVGIMKGVILGICPGARLVDLTHLIPPQQVLPGAYLLGTAWPFFPEGSVHLAVVDPGVGGARLPLAVEAGGHLFVGPDNGLLESALSLPGARAFAATDARWHRPHPSHTFHGRDVFSPVAAWLAAGTPIEALGPRVERPVRLPGAAPQAEGEGLVGQVVWVDTFGNLVTNLTAEVARPRVEAGARLEIGGVRDLCLSRTYADVPEGAILALIGSTGRVEISVRGGSAAAALRVGMGAVVRLHGPGA